MLAVNHGSYLDALYLVAALPPDLAYRFVAKREFTGRRLPRLFLQRHRRAVRRALRRAARCRGRATPWPRRSPAATSARRFPGRHLQPRSPAWARCAPAPSWRRPAPESPVAVRQPAGSAGGAARRHLAAAARSRRVRRSARRCRPPAMTGPAAMRLRDGVRAELLRLCGEPDLAPR
ncbi:MAG: hypothetical protein MZV65_44375 [Chromatiales bacterium]|nr:hypothetical protein [Chromatiales bacterium]